MDILKYFDSKIKDIMYDVVGLLFPGAFCLLITMWMCSIEKIHNILNYLGIPENTIQISGFSEIAVFLMFAYFYGVLLRGIYDLKCAEKIEAYSETDLEKAQRYNKDNNINASKAKTTNDKAKFLYEDYERKIRHIECKKNETVIEYLNKYIEKRSMYRVIYIQMRLNLFFIVLLFGVSFLDIVDFNNKTFVWTNTKWEYVIPVAFVFIGVINFGLKKIFKNYIEVYFYRVKEQILIGMNNIENKKGE